MNRSTLMIHTTAKPLPVPALVFGHLAIHKGIATRKGWVITHVPSGCVLVPTEGRPGYGSEREALAALTTSGVDVDDPRWLEIPGGVEHADAYTPRQRAALGWASREARRFPPPRADAG